MISLLRTLVFLLASLAMLSPTAWASAPSFSNRVLVTDDSGTYLLGRHLMILEDDTRSLGIDDVRTPAYTAKFHPSSKDVPSFGFNPSAYWLKVTLDRQTLRESQWVLEFGYAPMDHVDVYTIGADGQVSEQRGGAAMKVADRPYPHHKHVFELPLDRGETSLYVRVDSQGSKTLPLRLYRADTFAGSTSTELSILSIYVGTALSLIIYNLFIFASIREAVYFHYVLFLLSNLFFHLGVNGVSQVVGINDNDVIGLKLIPLSMFFLSISAGLFTSRFLNTAKQLPRLNRIITLVSFVCGIGFVLVWFMPYHASVIISASVGVPYPIFLIIVGTLSMRQGNKAARLYLLAWSMFLLGVVINASRLFGLIGTNVFTEYSMLWGSAAEAVLLSVALAARMRDMKAANEQAQAEKLQSQEALFRTQRQQLETQQSLNALQQQALENERKALAELKATQAHLIQQEKMAGLGLLSAGIAHEIKNPLNFMTVSNQTLEARLRDFQSFIGELMSEDTDPELTETFRKRFDGFYSQIDLINEGSQRVQSIITGMRSASRHDEAGTKVPTDPVDGLLSTVELVRATWKTLVDFDVSGLATGTPVNAHGSALNQVFTNLLVNAAQAIEERLKTDPAAPRGLIRLSSSADPDTLSIRFEDNGCGMTDEVKSRLFQPFFTTKDKDHGTGLGMGICLGIVEDHDGVLDVQSTPGQGSVMVVRLPVLSPVA